MEQEFKQKISSYKSSIIKDIIAIIIKDNYCAYEEEGYFKEIYGSDFDKMSESNMYGWFWEDGIGSFENYAQKYAPQELYNYFVWKWYSYDNFCYEEDYAALGLENSENFFANLESIPIPPEKENGEPEENPFEPTTFICEPSSLEDDNNFNSLLESLSTIVSFEKELLKDECSEVNENPYQSDWDKIGQRIRNNWLSGIMGKTLELSLSGEWKPMTTFEFIGINPNDLSQKGELTSFYKFRKELEESLYAYEENFKIWLSLSDSSYLDKRKLNEVLKELETSTNIEETVLKILNNNEGIYFISAVPFMRNLKNKTLCIFTFNLIFNNEIKECQFTEEEKESTTGPKIFEALNCGVIMNDIPNIIGYLKNIPFLNMKEYIIKYGFDPNIQDTEGNTFLMSLLIPTSENLLKDFLTQSNRQKILFLLKLDFSLSLKNKNGLNTYDIIMKYHSNDEELVEIISKIYGVPYDKTTIEFYKELSRVRSKNINDKLIEKF